MFGATPKPQPVATMPDSNSPQVFEAKRKAQEDILKRAGRQSTILTGPDKSTGGDTFSSVKLGVGA